MQINCIVDVNAGQNRENISLQKCDKKFQPGDGNQSSDRHHAKYSKRNNKPANDFQQCMARHHIGEQPDAET